MCLHLVNIAVPRYHVKKLLGVGGKVLKNLEEETGETYLKLIHLYILACATGVFICSSLFRDFLLNPAAAVCVGLTEKGKKEITSKSCMRDHRSYVRNFSKCENKAWKNSGLNGI